MKLDKKIINHIIEIVLESSYVENICDNCYDAYANIDEDKREKIIKHIQSIDEDEICDYCYCKLDEDDYNNTFESRAGNGSNERICTGYKCHFCGHEERY